MSFIPIVKTSLRPLSFKRVFIFTLDKFVVVNTISHTTILTQFTTDGTCTYSYDLCYIISAFVTIKLQKWYISKY